MQASRRSLAAILISVLCVPQMFCTLVAAQISGPAPAYDPRVTFAPLTLPDPVNVYRSGDGSPGPNYWQNGADYELHAELDTVGS
jgi:hypothetical protein